MASSSQRAKFRMAAVAFGIGVTLVALPVPASAGFFDQLFGDIGRAFQGPPRPTTTAPFENLIGRQPQERLRADSRGPAKAFCVRTCDGHFFPVQAHAGVSAAEACHSFCPASETKLYNGSNIDYATARDGDRYADLPNAFLYRKQLVAGCTCNGRDAFGLARVDAASDPTLRKGDIVATKEGLMAFTGNRSNATDFTPVENYSRLSKTMRDKLAETRIAPAPPPVASADDITASIPAAARKARAQAPR